MNGANIGRSGKASGPAAPVDTHRVRPAVDGGSIVRRVAYGLMYAFLTVVAVFQLYPLVWLFTFSLKDNQEIFGKSPFALPSPAKWHNYVTAWTTGNVNQYFWNSVLVTGTAVVLTVVIASMATFAISRLRWKLSNLVLGLIMLGLMIPVHSTLIPLFRTYMTLNLIDHPLSIILTYTAFNLPVTIMICLGFYQSIPREVEEAAVVDGATIHQIFLRVTLPMTTPVLATTAIINTIYNWNEFVFANTFISSDKYKTLTVGIQNFIGQYTTNWGGIGATLVLSFVPLLIAYLFLSNRIVEGITAGSIKG